MLTVLVVAVLMAYWVSKSCYCTCYCSAHGLLGVYKGLEAKLTQTILMAALMFLTYEKIASNVFRIMHSQMANGRVKV